EEGNTINADGRMVHSNDFSVNESSLTGEAWSVFKSADSEDNKVYSGTLVASGLAVYQIEKTGTATRIGKLGTSMQEIREEPTPLQSQIKRFVKGMALVGIFFFVMVWIVNFVDSRDVLNSLLKGLTLAMSVLPEE
ncbi:MAG TPA: cation-translocating P-type ATPase, partial [Chitinophagaceae bacterium]|nr:cation-translocating P-type ATPase [Chitinophagaceae bacterium]